MRISNFSWLVCLACYYFLVGIAINLSEELLKLEMLVEENPESLRMVASEIKSFLNGKMGETPWLAYIIPACLIIIINAFLGCSLEKKEAMMNDEEYERIAVEVSQFLEESKNTMSEEDYGRIIVDIRKFIKREKLVVGAKQLIDEDAKGMNPDSYSDITGKAKQIIEGEGGQDGNGSGE